MVTVVFHRFKQPVVLGYIIAGVIIGPYTPPFPLIHEKETIDTLAELGVILLMFSLGLEFSLRKLKQVGGATFIAAFLEIVLMVWIGYEIGRFFKWSTMDSIFLGAILSISSTTIIIKALGELGKTKERFAHLIFGILIIEDILAIAMIAYLADSILDIISGLLRRSFIKVYSKAQIALEGTFAQAPAPRHEPAPAAASFLENAGQCESKCDKSKRQFFTGGLRGRF